MSTPPSDDGRLELDEDGRVLDLPGSDPRGATAVLDLDDPDAVEDLAPNRVQQWVDTVAAPVVRRHRRGLVTAAAVTAAAVGVAGWITSRPPYVPPTFDVALSNGVLEGASIGGPRITADGRMQLALVARSRTPGDLVTLTGLVGPGLRDATVASAPITAVQEERVLAEARIDCSDPALGAAVPSSYRLTATGGSDAEAGSVPLAVPGGRPVTQLDRALTDYCLTAITADGLSISSVRAAAVPGTPLADLTLRVANLSPQALTLRTTRWTGTSIEVDLSSPVGVEPGATAVVTTQALLHDCSAPPAFSPLDRLPNPHGPTAAQGIAFEVGLGDRTRRASYAVPGADAVARALATACTGATGVTAAVESIDDVRLSPDGTWTATALVRARSDGIGITFGREHFDGGASGSGSLLSSDTRSRNPRQQWSFGPTRLDGGAGRMLVPVQGGQCADLRTASPQLLAVRVLTADRSVHPYEVPIDDLRVLQAVARGCGVPLTVGAPEALGWRAP